MRFFIVLAIIAIFNSSNANGLDPSFMGNYTRDYIQPGFSMNGDGTFFSIRSRNNRLILEDTKHNLKYIFKLNTKEEQFLPEEYIEYLHQKEPIAKMISAISISDIRVLQDGRKVEAKLNYHLGFQHRLGSINLIKITIPMSAEVTEVCVINYFGSEQIFNEPCITVRDTARPYISDVDSDMGLVADTVWGAFLDFILSTTAEPDSFKTIIFRLKQ